jgi:hypothetical protein
MKSTKIAGYTIVLEKSDVTAFYKVHVQGEDKMLEYVQTKTIEEAENIFEQYEEKYFYMVFGKTEEVAKRNYARFLEMWRKDHSGSEYEGMYPPCYEEWLYNDAADFNLVDDGTGVDGHCPVCGTKIDPTQFSKREHLTEHEIIVKYNCEVCDTDGHLGYELKFKGHYNVNE